MAKGKKSSGNTYTSKGQRPNSNKSVLKARRIEYKKSCSRFTIQIKKKPINLL